MGHAGTDTSPGAAGTTAGREPGAQKLRRDGGTREGSCRAQPGENAGHRGTSGEDEKARAGPGRDGAGQKGERMRWRAKRVSSAARCLYQAEGQAGGQAGCAGGQARAAGELPGVRQAESEGGQEDRQGERED